jgi:hypothetical protein
MITFAVMISFLHTFFDKTPKVPDSGQRVLLLQNGAWRVGYRAVSEPITSETGEVVIMVADEEEFRSARWDDRLARGKPWPVSHMTVPKNDDKRARRKAKRSSRRKARNGYDPGKNGDA